MMKNYDRTRTGFMNYQDFSTTFKDPEQDQDIYAFVHSQLNPAGLIDDSGSPPGEGGEGAADVTNIVIPLLKIKELSEMNKVEKKTFKDRIIPPELLEKLKVKLKPVPSWQLVWTSEGTNSRTQVSVWAVSKALTMWERSNKMRVSLGHYAVSGFKDPNSDKKHERLTLEFTDTSVMSMQHSKVLEMAVDQLVPHPMKYVQVWHQELGTGNFYAWKPIPPSIDHVALGMVGTTTPDEPDPEMVRCVPKAWVIPSKMDPQIDLGGFWSRRQERLRLGCQLAPANGSGARTREAQ
jgi:hypothetical protein